MTTVNPRTRSIDGVDRLGLRPDERWRASAACSGFSTNFFFPEDEDAAEEARAICAGCPVREECLEYALEHRQDEGIWGGMTGVQRRRLRRRRRDAARRSAA